MEQPLIPIYTLKQIIEDSGSDLNDPNILILDIDENDFDKIVLNYPSRVICLGILVIIRGHATLNIDSQQIELNQNDLINLFPNNVIEFKYFSPDCQIKVILGSVDFISELNVQINSQEALDLLSNKYSKVITLTSHLLEVLSFHTDRMKSLNLPDTQHVFYPEMLKMHLTLIIYEIANFNKTQTKVYQFQSSRKEDIAIQFTSLVSQNYSTHRNVQFYADKMFVSRKHLTRTVKQVFHKPPKQIIEDKIIAEAKVLLLKNELAINQVVHELKFDDAAMFSKFFKKNTGLTPSAYRKQKAL